jgi:hypothetical protein
MKAAFEQQGGHAGQGQTDDGFEPNRCRVQESSISKALPDVPLAKPAYSGSARKEVPRMEAAPGVPNFVT